MHAIKELFLESINCCHTGMNVILKIIAVCHFGKLKWLALKWVLGNFGSVLVLALWPLLLGQSHASLSPHGPLGSCPAGCFARMLLYGWCQPLSVDTGAFGCWCFAQLKGEKTQKEAGTWLGSWVGCTLRHNLAGHIMAPLLSASVYCLAAWAAWHFSRSLLSVVLHYPCVLS